MNLGLISGGNPPRFRSHINHDIYAHRHALSYYRDNRTYPDLQTPHFHKLCAVLRVLDQYDWLLWLDDDAFFTDFEQDMRRFIRDVPEHIFFVVCRSPVNANGGWTFINSGVFFIRNNAAGRHLLTQALTVPKAEVVGQYQPEIYGGLTRGEQAHIIYVLHRQSLLNGVRLHDWNAFNARPWHWSEQAAAETYPVVHFPLPDKAIAAKEAAITSFAARFGRDSTLVPPALLAEYSAVANAIEDVTQ